MRYRPLDLSFMSARNSPQREDIRNTAQMILANAGWGPTQGALKEIAAVKKKQKNAMMHKVSPLSSFFDLLSAPLYGLANALDESIAGHQSDPNDSVIEDIAKTAGGVITGGAKGFGAGLRGGSGLLDVLPGIDINDDWQSDPTDKTRMSDVAHRVNLGMSTKDALKPENWAENKAKLEALSDKPWFQKSLSEMLIPEDLERLDAKEDYFRNTALGGISADIAGDPLNLLFFGGKSAATAPRAIDEGLEAARNSPIGPEAAIGSASSFGSKGIKSAEPNIVRADDGFDVALSGAKGFKPPIDMTAPPVQSIDDAADIRTTFTIPEVSSFIEKGIGKTQPAGKSPIPVRNQHGAASKIARLALANEPGWQYKAADILRQTDKTGAIDFANTQMLIEGVTRMSAAGKKHHPQRLFKALKSRIADDVARANAPVKADRIANTQQTVLTPAEMAFKLKGTRKKVPVTLEGGIRLKRKDAQLANNVIGKFSDEILGTARAPGTGEGLARAIASQRNARYSGPQQARMWNQITSSLKYANPAKFDKTVQILRAVEDFFISKGAIPHSSAKLSESIPLRLSQVAEAIGPRILAENPAFITGILRGDEKALAKLTPEARQAIELVKANEALASAPAVQKGIQAGKAQLDEILAKRQSTPRMKAEANEAIKSARLTAATFGGGDTAARVAGEYIGNILGKSDPINAAISANRLKSESWLAKSALPGGIKNAAAGDDFLKSVTSAISRAAELPAPASLGRIAGPAAKVKDWLGARFNAAYGVQDMRPIYTREQAAALSTSGRRAKLINELGRRFDPKDKDLWHEAMRTAQMNGIAEGRVAELQAEIAKMMESLIGGTGLRAGAVTDTVVGRNRLMMAELNSNLKRFGLSEFAFTNKKVTDAAGMSHDFSKGVDWIKSWESWNIKDPYTFLHRIQSVVEHTVREKNMFDEIITRFASPKKHGNVKYGNSHPRLRGYYFNEEGARQAAQFVKALNEIATPNSKSMQYIDHVISKLKAALTIYVPGHHFTNLIGDTYFNWIAGVNKPVRYDQAMKVMLAQKGRYGDFASFQKLNGPDGLKQAIARSMVKPDSGLSIPAQGNKVIVTMPNGTKVTADMIYASALKEGILPSARVLEEVASDVTSVLDKIRPLGGKGQRAVHTVSEVRDHIPRLAQYIDGIAKSKQGFGSASKTSAAAVRKWHPDGLDLTKFERDVMKRIFPFYSWTRKAIPLAIESAIVAGPKVMAYPRLMEALALANGIQSEEGPAELFPSDQLFPDWLRDRGIGPIAGGPGNYLSVNPSTPILDIMTLLGHPGQSALDMANPLAKIPIEVAQSQTLGRNVPINDYADYAARQIPAVSHLGRASGQFGVSESTKKEGFPNYINILNILTGAKAVNTGKYQKSGQFDVRDYLKKKAEQQGR